MKKSLLFWRWADGQAHADDIQVQMVGNIYANTCSSTAPAKT
jgi:hypothetical protein